MIDNKEQLAAANFYPTDPIPKAKINPSSRSTEFSYSLAILILFPHQMRLISKSYRKMGSSLPTPATKHRRYAALWLG
jgi:hypothetical protein